MIPTPALPELRQIAESRGGYVCHLADQTNCWPNRNTDDGDRRGEAVLIAQGWDGDKLYGVVVED